MYSSNDIISEVLDDKQFVTLAESKLRLSLTSLHLKLIKNIKYT